MNLLQNVEQTNSFFIMSAFVGWGKGGGCTSPNLTVAVFSDRVLQSAAPFDDLSRPKRERESGRDAWQVASNGCDGS